ncbi:MAG: hypothetical protein ACOX8H_02255 [Ruminococcus sp.]|jgi:hypothetical protein
MTLLPVVDCYPANQRKSDIILEHLKDIRVNIRKSELLPFIYPLKKCKNYPDFSACAAGLGTARINTSVYYPSFYQNNKRVRITDYLRVMRLRKIWAEGTFAVLKREQKLNKI